MRLLIAAVGRMKESPERELAEHYRKRAQQMGRRIGVGEIEVVEIKQSRVPEVGKRLMEEAIAVANVIPERAVVVALDERGESLDSRAIAERLRRWRDDGKQDVIFVIGGDDGLASTVREKAQLVLGFGA